MHIMIFKIFSLLLIPFLFLGDCRPKKKKGIDDIQWKFESLKLSSEICQKFSECSQNSWPSISDKLRKLAVSSVKEDNCIEKNKKSNIFHLKTENPELAKTAFRNCHSLIVKSDCADIQKGIFLKNENCSAVRYIQEN